MRQACRETRLDSGGGRAGDAAPELRHGGQEESFEGRRDPQLEQGGDLEAGRELEERQDELDEVLRDQAPRQLLHFLQRRGNEVVLGLRDGRGQPGQRVVDQPVALPQVAANLVAQQVAVQQLAELGRQAAQSCVVEAAGARHPVHVAPPCADVQLLLAAPPQQVVQVLQAQPAEQVRPRASEQVVDAVQVLQAALGEQLSLQHQDKALGHPSQIQHVDVLTGVSCDRPEVLQVAQHLEVPSEPVYDLRVFDEAPGFEAENRDKVDLLDHPRQAHVVGGGRARVVPKGRPGHQDVTVAGLGVLPYYHVDVLRALVHVYLAVAFLAHQAVQVVEVGSRRSHCGVGAGFAGRVAHFGEVVDVAAEFTVGLLPVVHPGD